MERVSIGIAMLANGQGDPTPNPDLSKHPFNKMQGTALPGAFLANGGGATPVSSNRVSWNTDMVTTTGNLIIDLLRRHLVGCASAASTPAEPQIAGPAPNTYPNLEPSTPKPSSPTPKPSSPTQKPSFPGSTRGSTVQPKPS